MKALVTGFEPFGGEHVNASCEAVRCLQPRIDGLQLVTAILPTTYARSHVVLEAAIAREHPDIVLCVGQAGDRGALSIERVAVNLQDARMPDNDGAQPVDAPILADGPAAYFSLLPVRAIADALAAAQLPAEISLSAGTFVCNHVFYRLMHLARVGARRFRGGFLHVPCLSGQAAAGAATMTADDIARGIRIVLETTQARS